MPAGGSGQPEVLDVGGRPGLRPRTRRALLAAFVLACLIGAAAWLVDARVRDGEERQLAACREAALRADTRAATTVSTMVHYVEPALYAVPAGPRRNGLVALVADAADRALPSVRAALDECRSVRIGRLHPGLAGERAAYVDYLEARVRRLEEVAADGHSYYRDQPRLAALHREAFGSARG